VDEDVALSSEEEQGSEKEEVMTLSSEGDLLECHKTVFYVCNLYIICQCLLLLMVLKVSCVL